jgi:hypothetical protein
MYFWLHIKQNTGRMASERHVATMECPLVKARKFCLKYYFEIIINFSSGGGWIWGK